MMKSLILAQNYANLDGFRRFWKIVGSQNKIFLKMGGGHNKRELVVKNAIFGKWPPPLQLGTGEYDG